MIKVLEIMTGHAPVDPALLHFVQTRLEPVELPRDAYLLKAGQPAGHLWLLTDGVICRCQVSGERERVTRFYTPEDIVFGGTRPGRTAPALDHLRVETPLTAWRLPESDTLEALRQFPRMAELITAALEADARYLRDLTALLQLPGTRQKVLGLHAYQPELFRGVRTEQLAALLGVDPTTLYRWRKRLKI